MFRETCYFGVHTEIPYFDPFWAYMGYISPIYTVRAHSMRRVCSGPDTPILGYSGDTPYLEVSNPVNTGKYRPQIGPKIAYI